MAQPTEPPPPPTTDHTEWVWDGSQWVDQEKPPPPPVVLPPRPADTAEATWELGPDGWVSRPWTAEELASRQQEVDQQAARAVVRGIVEALQTEKARVQPIIDKAPATITGADTKDVARAVKRTADAVIDLVRYLKP